MSGTQSSTFRAGQVFTSDSHAAGAFESVHELARASALHGRQLSPAVMWRFMHWIAMRARRVFMRFT